MGYSSGAKAAIALAVVVIVVVVAVAAAEVLKSDDSESVPGTSVVYGDVNSDGRIDAFDVGVVADIVEGKRDAADWPLADANPDGQVDEFDLEVVTKAANGEKTTLYVVDCNGRNVAVTYPVTSYATAGGTNMRSIIAVLGMADGMAANGTNDYISPVLDKALYDGREDKIAILSGTSLTIDDVNILLNLHVELVIAEDQGTSTSEDVVRLLEGAGVTYLQLNFSDTAGCAASARTLGLLLGHEDEAADYNAWTLSIMEEIAEREGDLWGTATVLTVTTSNRVSGTSSDYYAASVEVGGDNVADWPESQRSFGAGDEWLLDPKYDVDRILHFRSTTFPETSQSYLDSARSYFGNTPTYQRGGYYLINGVLPLPVRNALMAEIMYPQCFDDGWSESLFQYYFDHFLGQDYDVSSNPYYWNLTDRGR